MSDQAVLYEREGDVVRLVLNRPEAHNAMDLRLMRELRAAAERCASEGVRAVCISAAGRAFSAGGDLGAFARAEDPRALLREMTDELHAAQSVLARLDAPLIAVVQGIAAGAGLSLACMCDLVLAGASARFTMAYTNAGLSPDGASTFFLPRLIGLRRTQELLYTNRVLDAAEAAEWQLVTRVVPDDALSAEAAELAQRIASGPTRAFGAGKRLLLLSAARDLEDQLDREGRSIADLSASADGQEGIRAFLEKRKPVFSGA